MYKYQNINTLEVKTHSLLKSELSGVSVPFNGCLMIAGVWKRLEKAESIPDAPDPFTQGVREIQPVDFVETWEVYNLSPEEVAELSEHRLSEAVATFLEEAQVIKSGYAEDEIKTWDIQLEEAQAHKAGPNADTPLIDAIISESGEDKEELVNNIIAKAAVYKVAVGKALGRKRKKAL